jgi:hypothetical protein
MATCDTCGNDYDKTFLIVQGERSGTFDSFECAVQAMAPTCDHCGCRIMGHGVEIGGTMFCCASCARRAVPEAGLADRDEPAALGAVPS